MKVFGSSCLVLFALIKATTGAPYEVGNPGINWTEEQAEIVKNKLLKLWKSSYNIINDFDFKNPQAPASHTDYVYDPDRRLSTVDCDLNESLCETYWGDKRRSNMAFTEPKAIRLAFHDCKPYTDGTGGCDGCLNFQENIEDNNMLQPTIAILEKMYLEKDFPPGADQLESSPKELGMSRADIWAFTGLVALNNVQETSRDMCATNAFNLTCNDWTTPCHTPFPNEATKLFKTGRSDCISSSVASPTQGYLASKEEIDPDANGNGPMTVKYFKDNFDMNPREALALMGAHTIGGFSTFQSHIDYAWVRGLQSQRNEVFNNEYFKTLAARPAHVKDKYCVGTMDGGKPHHEWHVFATLFEFYWRQDLKYKTWNKMPRRLLWHHEVTRAPVCEEAEEDKLGEGDTFWNVKTLDTEVKKEGFSSFWEYCCKQKNENCGQKNTCDPRCTREVQNRIRHLSSDVGFYLKWEYDSNGYPTTEHCDAFKTKRAAWQWLWGIKGGEIPGPAGCPKQDIDDGHGQPMWKSVDAYADNQEIWIEDFVKVWDKMNRNGYKEEQLVQGPTGFWSHLK